MPLDIRHANLLKSCESMFADRKPLEILWQEIALNFYPEMAEFTNVRYEGEEFADHLSTSYPLLARRSLGDSLGALLRPVNLDTTSPGVWFSVVANRENRVDNDGRRWLEWATGNMRRAMYDRQTGFVRALKEGDHQFATFGNAPISLEMNNDFDTLLYRSHHLKDVCWRENAAGRINWVCRKWTPTASQMVEVFGSKCHALVHAALAENAQKKYPCRHIVVSKEAYGESQPDNKRYMTPWVSVWIDMENEHMIVEKGEWSRVYIIPRWVTVPGSQYASSPAVTVALPDARLIQAMTLTLLEAAEKFADPPVVATQEAIRSDIQLMAGGHTWVDAEYDERLGDALHPLFQPQAGQGANLGLGMRQDLREMIDKAFFLDSLSLPSTDTRDMTAYEVGQRISEWIRRAMPIFEPMEFEYNGEICEETFELGLRGGLFGNMADLPGSLQGADLMFKFESPLHESAERRKGQKFIEAKQVLLEAAEIDQGVVPMLDAREALRDSLTGIGVPAKWTRSVRDVDEMAAAAAEKAAAAEQLENAQGAAAVAKDAGAGAKDLSEAGMMGGQNVAA